LIGYSHRQQFSSQTIWECDSKHTFVGVSAVIIQGSTVCLEPSEANILIRFTINSQH